MTIADFAMFTLGVFLGNLAAGFVGKTLIDWASRRAWTRMEARIAAQARGIQAELAPQGRPQRAAIYPKVKAN